MQKTSRSFLEAFKISKLIITDCNDTNVNLTRSFMLYVVGQIVINTLANDPKWLGAKTAATMVLHTWSQTLVLHLHVHLIVPNGGLDKQGNWQFPKRGKGNFLFPVVAMKKIFKGFFMAELKRVIEQGILALPPDFPFGIHEMPCYYYA